MSGRQRLTEQSLRNALTTPSIFLILNRVLDGDAQVAFELARPYHYRYYLPRYRALHFLEEHSGSTADVLL